VCRRIVYLVWFTTNLYFLNLLHILLVCCYRCIIESSTVYLHICINRNNMISFFLPYTSTAYIYSSWCTVIRPLKCYYVAFLSYICNMLGFWLKRELYWRNCISIFSCEYKFVVIINSTAYNVIVTVSTFSRRR